jgi:tryptophanyl-tRNA synthetase
MTELERECKSGEIICGDCKKMLAERVKKFLREHQKKREKARDIAERFFIK